MSARFPDTFKFGVASSSYQIEGAWNEDGKSESIWDYQTHTFPNRILDGSNGDIACDSYHMVNKDVALLKDLAVNFYRFSIPWCRILPTGFPNEINQKAIDHYNNFINLLIANDIEPIVTLYHWELPQSLENLGGWCNSSISDYFMSFARICFKEFGDRVKTWITINEPYQIADFAYGDTLLAPFYDSKGIGSYISGHNVLLAHGKVYRMYEREFKEIQNGRVGITIESPWFEPASDSKNDIEASERCLQMYFGWFAHPIFSENGDYPQIMHERIDNNSKLEGFDYSRLPKFTKEEIEMLKGSSDFFGLNHYTTFQVNDGKSGAIPSNLNDRGVIQSQSDDWESTAIPIFKIVPWGLTKLLQWIKNEYNNPEVIITENGYAGKRNDRDRDFERTAYIKQYLTAVLEAIKDGCNVTAYTHWTFLDCFEWSSGYRVAFGLYAVDFDDVNLKRTKKESATYYSTVIKTKTVN